MSTRVNGENGESTATDEDLERERGLLREAIKRAPDDVKTYNALVAFDGRHQAFACKVNNCAHVSQFGLMRNLFPAHWELYWFPFRAQAIEREKLLAGANPSPTIASLAEQAATEYLWLSALQFAMGTASANFGSFQKMSDLVDSAQRRYLRTLKMLAVVRRLEKGLEMHVTHHHTTVSVSQPVGGRFGRMPDNEIAEVEGLCVRQPAPIPLLVA